MKENCAITIGNFDGVHLGHVSVLNRLREIAKNHHLVVSALTFSNHPSTVFKPENPTPALCTLPHKQKLLREQNIENLLTYPFTKEFSQQTAAQFLEWLKQETSFTHLVLGHDAVIGKGREGNRETVIKLSEKLNFQVEYQPIYVTNEGLPVSSSLIRKYLKEGNLLVVEQLLGRKFSVYQKMASGNGIGKEIGFPTLNFSVDGLCLPPLGVYAVELSHQGRCYPAVANLGFAPTLKNEAHPLLEVHVLETIISVTETEMEIIFHQFLREEQKFSSAQALQNQITQDVEKAKRLFKLSPM